MMWLLLLAMVSGFDSTAEHVAPFDCAVNAFLILSAVENRELDWSSLVKKLPPRRPDGYSMGELIEAGDRVGFPLVESARGS